MNLFAKITRSAVKQGTITLTEMLPDHLWFRDHTETAYTVRAGQRTRRS